MLKKTKPPETMDYDKFSFIKGNREINNAHVNRLIRTFKVRAEPNPIIINEKGEILNGQHSFTVRKILGLPIPYFIVEGGDLDTVHRLNTNSKGWTFNDHALSWLCRDEPKPDYQLYLNFRKKYKFSHQITLNLLTGKNSKLNDIFIAGSFVVKDYDKACMLAQKIEQVGSYYTQYNHRSCVSALLELFAMKGFVYRTFIHKLAYDSTREKLEDHSKKDQYLIMFVKIYNTRTPANQQLLVAPK